MPIEVVIENGFDGAIGVCASVDGAGGGSRRLSPKDLASRRMPRQALELGVQLMFEDERA